MKNLYKFYLSKTPLHSFFCCLILLASCNSKKIEPTYIPAKVSLVIGIDFKSLSSKAVELKDLFNPDFLKQLNPESKDADYTAKLIRSGLDLQSTAFLFAELDKNESESYIALSFKITDTKKWEKTLKEESKEAFKIQSSGKMKFVVNNTNIIGWERSKGIFLIMQETKNENILKNKLLEIWNTKQAEALENKNVEFKNLLSSNYDVAIWSDYEKILSNASSVGSASRDIPIYFQDLFKLTKIVTASLHFEKGQLIVKSKSYLNPEIAAKYADLFKDEINANLLTGIPIKSPISLVSFALGMKGIHKILKAAQVLNEAEEIVDFLGISMEEIFDMLSGDMAFALKDMRLGPEIIPQIDFVFAMGIQKKETLDKLINKFSGLPFIKKRNKYYEIRTGDYGDYYLVEEDKAVFVTMSEDIKNALLNSNDKPEGKLLVLSKGKISSFYLDFQKLFKTLPKEIAEDDFSVRNFRNHIAPKFETIIITANPIYSNASEGEMILKLTEKNRNALAVFIEMMQKLSEKKKPISMK